MTAQPIYFDYMASTPLAPEVCEKMCHILQHPDFFANPASSTHIYGYYAESIIEEARQQLASCFQTQASEWLWTSGATESINLVIQGMAKAHFRHAKRIITFNTEHAATINCCKQLAKAGFEVIILPVKSDGLIDLMQLETALKQPTLLVSVLHVNNETGTIQPIAEIAEITRKNGVFLHVDGAQSTGKLSVNLSDLPIQFYSVSAHKAYGPKGIGALYVSQDPPIKIEAMIFGGHQEKGLRSGTLATHQIAGMGLACQLATTHVHEDARRIANFSDQILNALSAFDSVHLNGHPSQKVPHNLNLRFDHLDHETVINRLHNFAFSASSACQSGAHRPSHVLTALGLSHAQANNSVRISLGRYTTEKQINQLIAGLSELLHEKHK